MNTKLEHVYDLAENARKRILFMAQSVPEEKLFQTINGKWSLSQILVHLIAAEQISLQYMKKKALGIDTAGDTGMKETIVFALLRVSQRIPVKYKAPAILAQSRPENIPLPEIIQRWDTLRRELKLFLETFNDETLRRKVYKHPVVGRLNVLQAVLFFREHMIHHSPQIKRLIKA